MKRYCWKDLNGQDRESVLLRPAISTGQDVIQAAQNIIDDVRARGDEALKDYTQKFDGAQLDDLRVSDAEFDDALHSISDDAKAAIDQAFDNISAFHKKQGYQPFEQETMAGITCVRQVRAYETVGLYVPGGSAPLVSTTLMLGIPSQIAGCKNRMMCTPCDKNGNINPHILYVAQKCGITHVFKVGGAQAIAAMAYGTQNILKCDKIFGPGNAYVTAAKTLVAADSQGAAYDMPAGPSEVLVIADNTTNPAYAAADLLSQAEHDPMSQVILLCTDDNKIDDILKELEGQLNDLPRKEIAAQAIANSRSILCSSIDEAIDISNSYAPEHLILCFDDAEKHTKQIQNAGSVFVGQYSCESAGDYASGTNHVLPTYGYAHNYSGLSVEAFQKTITFQTLTDAGLNALGDTIETLAELEGLDAHKRAVSKRRAS